MSIDQQTLERAMRRALEIAATPGVPPGPNPRVGCVLLGPDGAEIAEGFHRGAGTPHAEAAALATAYELGGPDAARGATAVVTLEPCNHTGRTGPCSRALIGAGVAEVVFAQPDPNPLAAGGSATLRGAGVEVRTGLLEHEARRLNRAWTFALEHGRPFVTWKVAATLDGRSAAADGTSKWITGEQARRDVHLLRAGCDAILVGTGTVLADDPALTVRDEIGELVDHQPLRVVLGERELPAGARVLDDAAQTLHLQTRDVAAAVVELHEAGVQHVFLEGGPTVAAAFLAAGLVDEVVAYVAPKLLGSGRSAVADLGIESITGALEIEVEDVVVLGHDVRITGRPQRRKD
ncbi:MAG: bifunctional diaminohydroxyphosphoribosylaminopyrimidine deaminase/5-amino-6-(5-phosphoribosylamino)uracil reductase RibD [Marmoricola sp.]